MRIKEILINNKIIIIIILPSKSLFYSELNKFNSINPWKEQTKDKKATVYDKALKLYNEYLEIYFNQYMTISDAKKEGWVTIMILKIYFLMNMIIVCGQNIMKIWLIKKNL